MGSRPRHDFPCSFSGSHVPPGLGDAELAPTFHAEHRPEYANSGEALLKQQAEGREALLGFASELFSKAEESRTPSDQEIVGVLHTLEHFKTYLPNTRFTPVLNCAALPWYLTSHNLKCIGGMISIPYDMGLRWRKGTDHAAPDALSRLRQKCLRGPGVDASFLEYNTDANDKKGPEGPVLDGTSLSMG